MILEDILITMVLKENNFKSTAYHNTITVDGKNQSRFYKPEPAELITFINYDFVKGYHEAYDGVRHERSILFKKNEYWIINDKLQSDQNHIYEQYWHLTPEEINNVNIDDNIVETSNAIFVGHKTIKYKSKIGFISHDYMVKKDAPVIQATINNKNFYIPTIDLPL